MHEGGKGPSCGGFFVIIFNHVRLARFLGNYSVPLRSQFWYFFFYVLAGILPGMVHLILVLINPGMTQIPETETIRIYTLLGDGAALTLFIFGLIFAFQMNERGDNRDFITRYVCLSMPLGIQALGIFMMTFSMLIVFVVNFVNTIQMPDGDRSVAIVDSIPLLTLSAYVTASLYFNVQMIFTIRLAATQIFFNALQNASAPPQSQQ